jgi:hypothetical protein
MISAVLSFPSAVPLAFPILPYRAAYRFLWTKNLQPTEVDQPWPERIVGHAEIMADSVSLRARGQRLDISSRNARISVDGFLQFLCCFELLGL